jgi:NAD(P)-dependent dehydrogenase (short-subunit alcohol dehydrogenase family)
VVTGGGRGIGRIFARLWRRPAPRSRDRTSHDDLQETVRQIETAGAARPSTDRLTLTDDRGRALAAQGGVEGWFAGGQRLDVRLTSEGVRVLHNALGDVSVDGEVHVGGTFHCCRAVLPGMVQRGAGRIVSIVSHAGVHRWPTCSAYSVSKAAVIKLMENLSFETRRQGVSVFAFHPGLIARASASRRSTCGRRKARRPIARHPGFGAIRRGRRSVSPERAASFLVGLASGDADRLSGRYLTVFDDLRALQARAEEIAEGDLLTLGLRD